MGFAFWRIMRVSRLSDDCNDFPLRYMLALTNTVRSIVRINGNNPISVIDFYRFSITVRFASIKPAKSNCPACGCMNRREVGLTADVLSLMGAAASLPSTGPKIPLTTGARALVSGLPFGISRKKRLPGNRIDALHLWRWRYRWRWRWWSAGSAMSPNAPVAVRICPIQRVVSHVSVEIEALWITKLSVRHRRRLSGPIRRHEASHARCVIPRVRSRSADPIPHVRFGKYVRFRWGSPELEDWAERRIVSSSNRVVGRALGKESK